MAEHPLSEYIHALHGVLCSVSGNTEVQIEGVANNSSRICGKMIFCAVKGAKADGHDFIPDAIRRGAAACVIAQDSQWKPEDPEFPVIKVSDSYAAWAILCERYFDFPSRTMDVFAVTGTNGKTTSAYLLRRIFKEAFPAEHCGLISTVEYDTGSGEMEEASRTTPEAFQIQELFDKMRQNGCTRAVMEQSSHGLHQHRTGMLQVSGAVFTNLTGDHLDYHGDMEHYFLAKRILFAELLKPGAPAVINLDDPWGKRLYSEFKTKGNFIGFSLKKDPDAAVQITDIRLNASGTSFLLHYKDRMLAIHSALTGEFNVSNITGVAVLALELGISPELLVRTFAEPDAAPPGRLEKIELPENVHVFVDYAHTDDALFRVLSALHELPHNRIITVFGCGGDRDRTKRPRMASVVEKLSDLVVVTSDNPRTEDPLAIIREIKTGFSKDFQFYEEPDRRKAIGLAIRIARHGDLILIAGKGHENYQEIQGVKHHFDDREIVRQYGEFTR